MLDESLGVESPVGVAEGAKAACRSLIAAAAETFAAELPGLLPAHQGQWVIYRGRQRLAFGSAKTELLLACYARGYRDEELYVRKIDDPIAISVSW